MALAFSFISGVGICASVLLVGLVLRCRSLVILDRALYRTTKATCETLESVGNRFAFRGVLGRAFASRFRWHLKLQLRGP